MHPASSTRTERARRAHPARRTPRALLHLLGLLGLVSLGAPAVDAQGSWPTTHQGATWLVISAESPIREGMSLWFDGNWRRMGLGDEPQQVLLRPGILVTLAPGLRAGAGYAYVATAPYGELPTATPLREHRLWQQLVLSHAVGPVAVTHRYRWEQRWLANVVDGATGAFGYQQRARYMVRAQTPLVRRATGAPILGYLQEELLMPVGHGGASGRLTQNRAMAGVGIPLREGQRLDVGYMQLWNALPARPANEVNHTLTINWVLTGR
ncbi:MAG: DUF2490 domain-containing protein [Gemmatimonadetes bacterium]|nr:DUF2490 domain-containing protein [Gemmatimonadota bacterium]